MIEKFLKDFTVLEDREEKSILQILQDENGRFYAEVSENKDENSNEKLSMEIVRYMWQKQQLLRGGIMYCNFKRIKMMSGKNSLLQSIM